MTGWGGNPPAIFTRPYSHAAAITDLQSQICPGAREPRLVLKTPGSQSVTDVQQVSAPGGFGSVEQVFDGKNLG